MSQARDIENDPRMGKNVVETVEIGPPGHLEKNGKGVDKAAELLASEGRIFVSASDNKSVLRKIDLVILPLLLSIYALQSLDKTSLTYASVFGLIQDTHLHGQEYSWLGSIVYVAQLVMQPLVAFMLVKIPMGKFISVMVFLWSVILCGMVGARNFTGLMVTRFFLGAAESAVGMYDQVQIWY
jgi:hypothetical protein